MKHSRVHFYILLIILAGVGAALCWHRHEVFETPWFPGEKLQVWSIEAKVEFQAQGDPVKASLAIPGSQPGFELLGEHTASPGYGLSYIEEPGARRAEWSIRKAEGDQTLYYRCDMLVNSDVEKLSQLAPPDPSRARVRFSGPFRTVAEQMLARAKARSSDNFTLARELISEFNTQRESTQFLSEKQVALDWIVDLLMDSDVPARKVLALRLEDGRRRQPLLSYLQVFDDKGEEHRIFDVATGKRAFGADRLLWEYQSGSLLDLTGGVNSSVHFSMIRQDVPITSLGRTIVRERALVDFSIHSLPLEEQALFKGILLIPVGVLIVVLMRVFVGLRTSGTFMPVLIAMAFIQTSLVTGLVGFIVIVAVGLVIRGYLAKLNLLLVARISAVIVTVIIMISTFSVLAFQLGLTEGLKITFFPMVILSWTIERMSILWEEEGPHEVLVQGGGSLLVALLAYGAMMNEWVRHLTFNFIGLQLIFMALVLALGSYTGYRLMEVWRFDALLKLIDQSRRGS